MRTVSVPTFDEFKKYAFVGYKKVKIKNKPTHADAMKIIKLLPGTPCGYVPIERLIIEGKIEVRRFYDARQNTRKLKNFYVTLID